MSLPTTPVVRLMMTPGQAARMASHHRLGDLRVPARHVAEAFFLHAQVHVHDAGAGVEGVARLGGHLRRRHRHRVLLRVGQHAGQRAGEDGLVRHGVISSSTSSVPAATAVLGCRVHRAHRAGGGGVQPHLHLHRLHAHQRLAGHDGIASGYQHLRHDAGHRGAGARGSAVVAVG
jgi:hypothetical protein